jgi:hypothetical protein
MCKKMCKKKIESLDVITDLIQKNHISVKEGYYTFSSRKKC